MIKSIEYETLEMASNIIDIVIRVYNDKVPKEILPKIVEARSIFYDLLQSFKAGAEEKDQRKRTAHTLILIDDQPKGE